MASHHWICLCVIVSRLWYFVVQLFRASSSYLLYFEILGSASSWWVTVFLYCDALFSTCGLVTKARLKFGWKVWTKDGTTSQPFLVEWHNSVVGLVQCWVHQCDYCNFCVESFSPNFHLQAMRLRVEKWRIFLSRYRSESFFDCQFTPVRSEQKQPKKKM